MKKIVLLLFLIIITFPVKAEELPDITQDIEIRTKWYKEQEIGQYHPKGEDLLGYTENSNKIKYSDFGSYSSTYCSLSPENNIILKTHLYKYKYVSYTKYITLTNFEYSDNIFVFYQGNKMSYDIISNQDNVVVLKLSEAASTEYLLFFIDYEQPYNITLSFDKELKTIALSKDINGEKVLIPNKTWITENTHYRTGTSSTNIINNDLVINMGSSDTCKYQKIYTYRYKIEKIYYDDEYHHYVEGYLPDMSDIKVYYKGEELIKTIEVPVYEKVIEYVTKYQTIEIPKEIIKTIKVPSETVKTVKVCPKEDIKNNSSCPPSNITKVVSLEEIEKIIKAPQLTCLLICFFVSSIILIIFLLVKKYVIRK